MPGEETAYRERWIDRARGFEGDNFIDGFDTPDGRFHFRPDWRRVGNDVAAMPVLPDHIPVANEPDATHPFRLVAAPARQFLNTSFTESPTSRAAEMRPTLLIRGDDAGELGVADGDIVPIGNALADLLIHARLFDGMQTGVVVVESIWPNAAFIEGLGINALVSAQPGIPNGGAIFHDTAIWIRAQQGEGDA